MVVYECICKCMKLYIAYECIWRRMDVYETIWWYFNRPVARFFCGGCVTQEPEPNLLMFEWYAMHVPKMDRAEWRTYGLIEIGTSFNATGNSCERIRREPVWGSGGMAPRKFSNLKALKCHLQHSQAESDVKIIPKTDRYFFLNLTKKSVVISCKIFL